MIAVLVHAADARACVAGGAGVEFVVRHHTSVREILTTLAAEDVALVVVDATDPTGRSMAPAVIAIRGGFPAVPILAYCSLSAAASSGVLAVARAGVTSLVFRGVDDAGYAMRAAVRSARQGSVTQRVHDDVVRHLPIATHPLLAYAITRAGDGPTVDDAARSLGVDRKTLFNWFRMRGVAGPREFLNWVRLAIGVGLLENPSRTAEHVALELGFASGTSFRNMLQRYTGLSCSEIRAEGGLSRILALFALRLAPQASHSGHQANALSEPKLRVAQGNRSA